MTGGIDRHHEMCERPIEELLHEQYLTPEEVGRIIRVNKKYVMGYILSGELPATRLNHSYKVCREDLYRFMNAHRYQAQRVAPGGSVEEATAIVYALEGGRRFDRETG